MKKPCPVDASHYTSLFSSIERIWRHDCRKYHPWPLNGRKPLIANNRQTARSKA